MPRPSGVPRPSVLPRLPGGSRPHDGPRHRDSRRPSRPPRKRRRAKCRRARPPRRRWRRRLQCGGLPRQTPTGPPRRSSGRRNLVVASTAMSLPKGGATEAAAGMRVPAAATAQPARTGLLWGAALLAAAIAAVLWWPTRPTPPAVPVAPPAVATAPASPEAADEPAPADVGRYDMLVAAAGGSHARIARELAGALSTEANAMRLVPLPGGADPITGLQSPGRLAIARLDALRAARGSAAPPLRVLTPLFPEAVLFVVRADSPLKYIHDLSGRRLSIGPVQSDGSHTVRAVYRRLFGAEMTGARAARQRTGAGRTGGLSFDRCDGDRRAAAFGLVGFARSEHREPPAAVDAGPAPPGGSQAVADSRHAGGPHRRGCHEGQADRRRRP